MTGRSQQGPRQPVIGAASIEPPMRLADAAGEAHRLARPVLAALGLRAIRSRHPRQHVQRPGGDAAVVRINDGPKALALTADVTPRYCEADPFEGGKQAVAEAWRNLTAVGALPARA